MALDIDEALFNTDYNYQKIALSGSGSVVVANNTPNYAATTIAHNLGYIPSVRVWYTPDNSKRFPISQEQYVDDSSFTSEVNLVVARAYLTTNNLVLEFSNASGSNKTVTYYYRVYYDS